jgi:AcrR family transcriptional regulator
LGKRAKTTPRKRPQQDRAQETVDAILAGAAKLLTTSGYDTMSTNRIAVAAGVSIGSLYQYFPSKEAIVAALVEKQCELMGKISRETLASHAGSGIEVTAREVVKTMVAAHGISPKLHRALHEQIPRVGKLKLVDEMHTQTVGLVAQYIASRRELKVEDPGLAAFFVVKAVDALLHEFEGDALAGWSQEQLVDEAVRLIVGYLRGPA